MTTKFPSNIQLLAKLKEFQNKFDDVMKKERSNFYCNIIKDSANTTKTMWDVVKLETGRCGRSLDFTESIRTPNGSKYSSKVEVVDAVNSHFVNAAATCGTPRADVAGARLALAGARPPADRSIRFKPFSPLEVFNIITKGVAHKPTKDIYEISVSLLCAAAAPLSFILSELLNSCVRGAISTNIKKC
ncbi:RNA-directed DNA polymerase [Operophtera brumata]|uniref:RNA-directed DNA polymerase n=1 Tax=Operophtera brumata TaxID=104452 RepID=A0A0L7KPZ3_OPEBR|nr:RNA-directed DNA polymerase [Operophtera brumata]